MTTKNPKKLSDEELERHCKEGLIDKLEYFDQTGIYITDGYRKLITEFRKAAVAQNEESAYDSVERMKLKKRQSGQGIMEMRGPIPPHRGNLN